MSLSKYDGQKDVIVNLPDRPNQELGLTSADMKQKFEEQSDDIINYIDNTLTVEQDSINSDIETRMQVEETTSTDHENRITQNRTDIDSNDTDIANRYTKAETDGLLGDKADKVNVLELDNTTPFTPTGDYQPGTKKYTDDVVAGAVLGNLPDNSIENTKLDQDIKIGSLANLNTTDKSNVVGAINENTSDISTNTTNISNIGTQVDASLTPIKKEVANLKLYSDLSQKYQGTDLTLYGTDFETGATLGTNNSYGTGETLGSVTTSQQTVSVVGGDFSEKEEVTINNTEFNIITSSEKFNTDTINSILDSPKYSDNLSSTDDPNIVCLSEDKFLIVYTDQGDDIYSRVVTINSGKLSFGEEVLVYQGTSSDIIIGVMSENYVCVAFKNNTGYGVVYLVKIAGDNITIPDNKVFHSGSGGRPRDFANMGVDKGVLVFSNTDTNSYSEPYAIAISLSEDLIILSPEKDMGSANAFNMAVDKISDSQALIVTDNNTDNAIIMNYTTTNIGIYSTSTITTGDNGVHLISLTTDKVMLIARDSSNNLKTSILTVSTSTTQGTIYNLLSDRYPFRPSKIDQNTVVMSYFEPVSDDIRVIILKENNGTISVGDEFAVFPGLNLSGSSTAYNYNTNTFIVIGCLQNIALLDITLEFDLTFQNNFAADYPIGTEIYRSVDSDIESGDNTTSTESVTTADDTVGVNNDIFTVGETVVVDNTEEKVVGSKGAVAANISQSSYTGNSKSVASEDGAPYSIHINSDETTMWILGYNTDTVYEYDISAGIENATYTGNSFSVGGQDTVPTGIHINTDETTMWIVGRSTDTVYEYDISTGIENATYTGNSKSVASQDGNPYGIHISTDETTMWMVGIGTDTVYEYDISTGIQNATYTGNSFSVASEDELPYSIHINSDETKMWILGIGTDTVYEYDMSTGIENASYTGNSFSVATEDGAPAGIHINTDETTMWMVGSSTDTVYEYLKGNPQITFNTNFTSDYPSGVIMSKISSQNMRLDVETIGDRDVIAASIIVDSDLTVTAEASIVDSLANESYITLTEEAMTDKGDGTKEYDFTGSVGTLADKVTVKFNITNTSGATKSVYKVLGSVN